MLGRYRKAREAVLLAVNPASGAARELKLNRSESSVGSHESNDLVVRDDTVSRRHALIRRRWGRWQVADNGSTNGTYVGSQKAVAWIALHDGEEIRFGGARFVFRSHNLSGVRAASVLGTRPSSGLRTVIVLVAVGLVTGFAAMQYFLYRSYQSEVASSRFEPRAHRKESPHGPANPRSPVKTAAAVILSPATMTPGASSDWLWELNYWREMAGVVPVRADSDAVRGATAHARYMVKNYMAGNPQAPHYEQPGNPWYTPEGAKAALNGNEYGPGPGPLKSASFYIDGWMSGSFHRLSLIERDLTAAAYGHYCESGVCAEVLVLDPHLPARPAPGWFHEFPEPVMFPSNTTKLPANFATLIRGEWPEPLTCAGYSRPAGFPITLQFDSRFVSKLLSFSLVRNGTAAEACGYDSTSYLNPDPGPQMWGREVLKGRGAVVLIPRKPLQPGATYMVTVNVQAQRDPFNWGFPSPFANQMRSYTWSFSLGA
jgi:uncharacterized protein YkwD